MIATENPGFPNIALIASNGSVKYKYNVIYIYNVIMLNINKMPFNMHLIAFTHQKREIMCYNELYHSAHSWG